MTDWPGPAPDERPTAYIVVLGDSRIWRRWDWDTGIMCQTMLLAATERGLGGCMIASIDQAGLRAALGLPEHLEIVMVVALGKPKETVVLEDGQPEPAPYWRDKTQVPSRAQAAACRADRRAGNRRTLARLIHARRDCGACAQSQPEA